jgi:hypothetical protein
LKLSNYRTFKFRGKRIMGVIKFVCVILICVGLVFCGVTISDNVKQPTTTFVKTVQEAHTQYWAEIGAKEKVAQFINKVREPVIKRYKLFLEVFR